MRRKPSLRNRISAQLVCEGASYRKPQHALGTGMVGLDLGPSSLVLVADQAALVQPSCPEVAPDTRALRRLDRQLDRQHRANNPSNYNERGRIKPGRKRWKASKRQRKIQAKRREVHRTLPATRRRSHGQLAHRVLTLGVTFQPLTPLLPGWQRRFGRRVEPVRAGAVCLDPLPSPSQVLAAGWWN